MGSNVNHGWTDERVEVLKSLWRQGRSASQIAKQLGGVTRNAVIGKVHRLELSETGKFHHKAPATPRAPRPAMERPASARRMFGVNAGKPPAPPKPLPAPMAMPMTVTGRPWLTRNFGECAYIVSGEGADAISCCAPARQSNDWCYCPDHAKRIFAAPSTNAQRTDAAKLREAKARAMQARAA